MQSLDINIREIYFIIGVIKLTRRLIYDHPSRKSIAFPYSYEHYYFHSNSLVFPVNPIGIAFLKCFVEDMHQIERYHEYMH